MGRLQQINFRCRYHDNAALKEQSRPCASKLTSADVRLATKLGRGQFCDVIGQRHEFHLKDVTGYAPEMVQ